MATQDLSALLEFSRSRNKARGITGMLLYVQKGSASQDTGRFMQVLEGNEAEVRLLFESIKNDSRNERVRLLNEVNIIERNFANWTMGFHSVTDEQFESLPGYFELNDKFIHQQASHCFNFALTFLHSFYRLGTS